MSRRANCVDYTLLSGRFLGSYIVPTHHWRRCITRSVFCEGFARTVINIDYTPCQLSGLHPPQRSLFEILHRANPSLTTLHYRSVQTNQDQSPHLHIHRKWLEFAFKQTNWSNPTQWEGIILQGVTASGTHLEGCCFNYIWLPSKHIGWSHCQNVRQVFILQVWWEKLLRSGMQISTAEWSLQGRQGDVTQELCCRTWAYEWSR